MTKTRTMVIIIPRGCRRPQKRICFKPLVRGNQAYQRKRATLRRFFDCEPPLRIKILDPLAAVRRRQRWMSENPNVIDLKSHPARTAPGADNPGQLAGTPFLHNLQQLAELKCLVCRPGRSRTEVFEFVRVPEEGEEVVLAFEPDVYVVRSITHLASEPGSGLLPCVRICLRAKPKKKR